MTTPEQPEPGTQPPAAQPAPEPAPPAGQPEQAPPAVPQATAPQATAPQATAPQPAIPQAVPPQYLMQQPDPFAPVPRPPKTPWIAPQRKFAATAIAIAAAVVLLVVGGVAGWAIADRGPQVRNVQFDRPGLGDGPRQFPGGPNGNHRKFPRGPLPSATPSPS